MANSTPRRRSAKAAAPPAADAPPDPVPPAAPPASPPASKPRSGWRIAAMVVGALVILALVCGGGLVTGFGMGRGAFGLSRLNFPGWDNDEGRGWMMPYGPGQMMPYGPYHHFRGDGTMPYGGFGNPAQGAAYLGVTYQAVADDQAKQNGLAAGEGALVSSVVEGSPAAQAGLQAGDIIVSVDGQRLTNPSLLRYLVMAHAPGDSATLVVVRDGKDQTVVVKLGQAPDTGTP